MVTFRAPQVVLVSRDPERAAAFYGAHGFAEVFRTPSREEGPPIHVDVELDGRRIGLASADSCRDDHGLDPVAHGQRAVVVLWTDDTAAAYQRLLELGATPVRPPSPWLGRLLIAWAEDPDGHPLQVVQPLDGPADESGDLGRSDDA